MGRLSAEEADLEISRIRKLLAKGGSVADIARMTNRDPSSIYQIKLGYRHKRTGAIKVNDLQLRHSSKLCRRCGDQAGIITKDLTCIKCTLKELGKQGLIEIQPENDSNE